MQPHPYALLAAAAAQQSAESSADPATIMAAMSAQQQAIGLLNSRKIRSSKCKNKDVQRSSDIVQLEDHNRK